MITIKPFKALRPKKDLYSKIVSLPYDVLGYDECKKIIKKNPLSLLRIIRAEVEFDGINPYSNEVYLKAKENFNEFIKNGYFVQDKSPYFYVYRLTKDNIKQIGFICTVSVENYENGKIKRHENTTVDKEKDRVKNIETLNAQTGFVFLIYKAKENLYTILNNIQKETPEVDFITEDNIGHTLWIIKDQEKINFITDEFKKIDALYIADGHHRAAAAAIVAKNRKNKNISSECNYFLSIIYPDDSLHILSYNRAIKGLNGLSKEDFFKKIEINFKFEAINPNENNGYRPLKQKNIGMYIDKQWYLLKPKSSVIKNDPLGSLDVSILQDNILNPILNIIDPRTDNRIEFIGGNKSAKYLVEIVDNNSFAVSFSMFPPTISQLTAIADANNLMPPKSTWFEPKPRSGMAIHLLD